MPGVPLATGGRNAPPCGVFRHASCTQRATINSTTRPLWRRLVASRSANCRPWRRRTREADVGVRPTARPSDRTPRPSARPVRRTEANTPEAHPGRPTALPTGPSRPPSPTPPSDRPPDRHSVRPGTPVCRGWTTPRCSTCLRRPAAENTASRDTWPLARGSLRATKTKVVCRLHIRTLIFNVTLTPTDGSSWNRAATRTNPIRLAAESTTTNPTGRPTQHKNSPEARSRPRGAPPTPSGTPSFTMCAVAQVVKILALAGRHANFQPIRWARDKIQHTSTHERAHTARTHK